jgi:hypothetical protein
MLSYRRSFERYDEPETIPSSIRPFCLMSADGGHLGLTVPLTLQASADEVIE